VARPKGDARVVRVPRAAAAGSPGRAVPRPLVPGGELGPASPPPSRRPNRAATARAIRLSVLYVLAIGGIYAVLVTVALAGPTGGSPGTASDLTWIGVLAAALAALGVAVSLGAAPRWVELSDAETVVMGRFGRRYSFPGRGRVRTTVLQRFPSGFLASVAIESVEISGGSTRRSFLLDEGLLEPANADGGPDGTAPR